MDSRRFRNKKKNTLTKTKKIRGGFDYDTAILDAVNKYIVITAGEVLNTLVNSSTFNYEGSHRFENMTNVGHLEQYARPLNMSVSDFQKFADLTLNKRHQNAHPKVGVLLTHITNSLGFMNKFNLRDKYSTFITLFYTYKHNFTSRR
jgi:hypothetical protein